MNVLRLVWAVIVAAAGTVVSLAQLDLPSRESWAALEDVQYAAVAVVAVTILHQTVRAATHSVAIRQVREFEQNLWAAQSATVAQVVRHLDAPWDEIGIRVYRVRREWTLRRRLVQVSGVRAGAPLTDLPASLRPGVGVVGVAFQAERTIDVPWESFVRTALSEGPEAWHRRARADRYGLNWGQLRRPASHADRLQATPIFDGDSGRPLGCVLISGPLDQADPDDPKMNEIVGNLVTAVLLIGPPPAEWWRSRG